MESNAADPHKQFKELKCDDCEFTTNRNQKAIHDGIKHKCEMRSKQFIDKGSVITHRKSVHLMKNLCDLCRYKTTS